MTVVTVNLDDENVEWIDSHYNNRSAFINDLVERARKGQNDVDRIIAQYQREQLERERATLETRLDGIDEQLEAIDERVDVSDAQRQSELEDTIGQLEGVPRDPSNPAIRNHAEKLGMKPETLVEKLEERDDE